MAVTAKGQGAVYAAHVNDKSAPHLGTYKTLESVEGDVPDSVYQAAQGAQRGAVQLDI